MRKVTVRTSEGNDLVTLKGDNFAPADEGSFVSLEDGVLRKVEEANDVVFGVLKNFVVTEKEGLTIKTATVVRVCQDEDYEISSSVLKNTVNSANTKATVDTALANRNAVKLYHVTNGEFSASSLDGAFAMTVFSATESGYMVRLNKDFIY